MYDEGLETGLWAGGDFRFSLGRSAGYLGVLACAEWDQPSRADGAWKLDDARDGDAVRPFGGGSSPDGSVPHRWHVYVTVGQSPSSSRGVSPDEVLGPQGVEMVAGDGIEP